MLAALEALEALLVEDHLVDGADLLDLVDAVLAAGAGLWRRRHEQVAQALRRRAGRHHRRHARRRRHRILGSHRRVTAYTPRPISRRSSSRKVRPKTAIEAYRARRGTRTRARIYRCTRSSRSFYLDCTCRRSTPERQRLPLPPLLLVTAPPIAAGEINGAQSVATRLQLGRLKFSLPRTRSSDGLSIGRRDVSTAAARARERKSCRKWRRQVSHERERRERAQVGRFRRRLCNSSVHRKHR